MITTVRCTLYKAQGFKYTDPGQNCCYISMTQGCTQLSRRPRFLRGLPKTLFSPAETHNNILMRYFMQHSTALWRIQILLLVPLFNLFTYITYSTCMLSKIQSRSQSTAYQIQIKHFLLLCS